MENDDIVSLRHLQVDPQYHIDSVCKIIDHAQHTKFKYIDLNLLRNDFLEKNNHYSYLLGVLKKYKEQTMLRNTKNIFEMKVMVELSEMLQTCKMLSPAVLDAFLVKVVDWYSNKQSNSNQLVTKLIEINSQRSKSTGRKMTEESVKNIIGREVNLFQRPQTGVLRPKKLEKYSKEDRPSSAMFGNINYHKYRPYSGALTNASTRVTKNMSVNEQTVDAGEKTHFGELSEEGDQQIDQVDLEQVEIDDKKPYKDDDNIQEQQNNQQNLFPKRRGDFQRTKQGDLVLHQILGNQKHIRESKNYRSKIEAKEIQDMVDAYQKRKNRGSSQSYRRIESAKVFRNIRGGVRESRLREENKENMDSVGECHKKQTEIVFEINSPQIPNKKSQFSTKRPLSAVINPWKGEVNSHLQLPQPYDPTFQQKGYSLTRPISAVPQRTIFEPLDQKYIRDTNIMAYDQIEKIKLLLGKNIDIPVRQLSKALVYDEWEVKEEFSKPYPQLLNNPFMKKKKKKVLKKKKKIL